MTDPEKVEKLAGEMWEAFEWNLPHADFYAEALVAAEEDLQISRRLARYVLQSSLYREDGTIGQLVDNLIDGVALAKLQAVMPKEEKKER